jgi:DNA repair protein RecO (recombination protein O)
MLHKTRGIVFRTTEYGETSLVVQIYTELFGLQSYIINSVRKKHPKHHANLFQPLTPVDLVVYHKERPGLQRISEIKAQPPLISIPFDIIKTSLIFFLDEILVKSIKEEESNPPLFDFLMQSVEWLDHTEEAPVDFHLVFMILLSKYLGFAPARNQSGEEIFNLADGHFQTAYPEHPHFIPFPLSSVFAGLLNANYTLQNKLTANDRKLLTEYLIEYYALHLENFGEVKSHKVLGEVLG